MRAFRGTRAKPTGQQLRGATSLRAARLYLALSLVLLIWPTAQAEEPRLLRFAMSAESPPTSYEQNGEARGIIRDLLEALFSEMPQYRIEFYPRPWARAQYEVSNERLDAFCTFPSEARQDYARFASQPMYVWDYGNLVYNRHSPTARLISKAKSFDDLSGLRFISQTGVDWEKENVPAFIYRHLANTPPQMMHMLFRRQAGDFLIMSQEQAFYYAERFGYTEQLGNAQVDFIPNSQVPFHIGLRRSLADSEQLIAEIDRAMLSAEFQARRHVIIERYRTTSIAGQPLTHSPSR